MRRYLIVLLVASAASTHAEDGKFERRCGWLENPSPANVSLTDRDGEWFIGTQGGPQAEGDWDARFPADQWVRTNGFSYGYGCACISMKVDVQNHNVLAVRDPQAKPLEVCRTDNTLSGKPYEEYSRMPMRTFRGKGYSFNYPQSWRLREEGTCQLLDAPGRRKNEEYTLNICARPASLEQVAEDAIFGKDENGVWMRYAGKSAPSPVRVREGDGWTGLSAEQSCGVSDEQGGFHSAGGMCFWAALSDGATGLLMDSVGFYQDFQQIGIIVDSVRFSMVDPVKK
ncbi:DUF4087 domain-containing protein [Aquipseudomonas ullengensis]|uniref:DUF4087 domain-containing protein n=1 Tax=Aquipseudomonas ullengensis TaxID=2759166 RepID=A0A7W4LJH2_9GAMM|nr:DUF4087 domain-containing protein [Pseudomonas ullengensis]MBB2494314.1 DUF4087 domain-containing protein [Pseudomonas ullengensis]